MSGEYVTKVTHYNFISIAVENPNSKHLGQVLRVDAIIGIVSLSRDSTKILLSSGVEVVSAESAESIFKKMAAFSTNLS